MARVLLGVTGSVAAVRTPALYAALRQRGHEVKVVATQASLYFFDPAQESTQPVSDAIARVGKLRGEYNFDVVGVAVGASRPKASATCSPGA